MGFSFRVVNLTTGMIEAEKVIEGAASPEAAAHQVLGFEVARSGARDDLVARVYWQSLGQPVNMVRLYRKGAVTPPKGNSFSFPK